MKKIIKEKDGKYKIQTKLTLKDALLVLTIVMALCTIAFLFEV